MGREMEQVGSTARPGHKSRTEEKGALLPFHYMKRCAKNKARGEVAWRSIT